MKHLGIDYGEKRIGIAVSDDGGKIAFPKATLQNQGRKTFQELKKIIKAEKIGKIVIGLPLGSKSEDTGQTQKTKTFAQLLKKEVPLPIVFQNELLTSKSAKASGARGEKIDASAAALILQAFLDR